MKNIVAACGFRYDKELVPGLLENLKGIVNNVVLLDDTGHDSLWRNEYEYRLKIREMALDAGADWLYITSPDERLEKGAGERIRQIVESSHHLMVQFDLREMWTPDEYRIDGIWGRKKRVRLFPLKRGQRYEEKPIQCHPYPVDEKGKPLYRVFDSGINIYHLKMINPKNRKLRAEVFKKLDPENDHQKIGYDYLYDETDLKLEKIQKDREYMPKYEYYEFKVPQQYL